MAAATKLTLFHIYLLTYSGSVPYFVPGKSSCLDARQTDGRTERVDYLMMPPLTQRAAEQYRIVCASRAEAL